MATTFKSIIDWPKGEGTLKTTINDSIETVVLDSGDGDAFFPASNFVFTIGTEQILCTSRSTDTCTCTGGRGYNGSSAAAHTAGATVSAYFTTDHFTDIQDAINDIEDGITPLDTLTVTGAFVANEGGGDNDCRIEGDTDVNLFYIDAGNDRVGISTDTPEAMFHVLGTTSLDGTVDLGGVVTISNSAPKIRTDTADGSDNKRLILCGGGDSSSARGALLYLYGNEIATAGSEGRFVMQAGADAAGGDLLFYSGDGTLGIYIGYTGGVTLAGDLIVDGGDVGITADTDLLQLAADALTVNGSVTATGTVTASNGVVTAGADGATRGALTLWDGSGGNTPGYVKIGSPNGTVWYLFVEDDGTLKVHNAVPAANGDGSEVGAQT